MIIRKADFPVMLAAKGEGASADQLDVFPVHANVEKLRKEGYFIFYRANVEMAIDTHVNAPFQEQDATLKDAQEKFPGLCVVYKDGL